MMNMVSSFSYIQGVPKIQVNRPPFDGRGQNKVPEPETWIFFMELEIPLLEESYPI